MLKTNSKRTVIFTIVSHCFLYSGDNLFNNRKYYVPILFSFYYLAFIIYCSLFFYANAEKLSDFNEGAAKQKIALAIERFKQTDRKNWAYKLARYENEEGDVTCSLEQFLPKKNNVATMAVSEKRWQQTDGKANSNVC